MKKVFLIFVFILSFSLIFAQDTTSLLRKLGYAKGAKKAEIYCLLAEKSMKKNYNQAINYAKLGLFYSKEHKDTLCTIHSLDILANIYSISGSSKKAQKMYNSELNYLKLKEDYTGQALVYYNIARLYQLKNKSRRAQKYYIESLKLAEQENMHDLILQNCELLFGLKFAQKDYKSALNYFKTYIRIKDSSFTFRQKARYEVLMRKFEYVKDTTEKIINKKNARLKQKDSTLTIVSSQRDTLKKVSKAQTKEIEKLNYEKAYQLELLEKQRLQRNFMLIVIVFVLLILAGVYRQFKVKQRLNAQLTEQNQMILQQKEEIEAQRDNLEELNNELEQQKEEITTQRDEIQQKNVLIEHKNESITSSIRYAKRIQNAALPSLRIFSTLFTDYFILFRPRDIVSGDFYWLKKIGDKIVVTVADCTGHGVPGAFVSMLGISLLNEISQKYPNANSANILNELRKLIKQSLNQFDPHSDSKDGMDMALCIIDEQNKTLDYAGANNPLLHYSKGELATYKATRNPVAIHLKEIEFTNQIISYEKGDMIYLFSDGYVDQFGGEKSEKFKIKSFKILLNKIAGLNCSEQELELGQTLDNWMSFGEESQIDDITVMGIRL